MYYLSKLLYRKECFGERQNDLITMKEYNLFGFQVEIDEDATKEWYDKADEWSCECGDCGHF